VESRPIVLSIAGLDPSSGAGITADVKTAAALGCYAVTCVTALTVQSTQGVFSVVPVRPELVRETLFRLCEDVKIAGVRVGMLGSGEVAAVVAEYLQQSRLPNIVLDPVLRSSSGAKLIDEAGVATIRGSLLQLCDVVTPNTEEAAELAGAGLNLSSEPWDAALPKLRMIARRLHELGCQAVVITGGHLKHPNDYLSYIGGVDEQVLAGSRVESGATHGTGCAFATALACGLAQGRDLLQAAREAKEYVRRAIAAAYPVGKGIGPVNQLFG